MNKIYVSWVLSFCCLLPVHMVAAVYDCFLFLNEIEILDIRLHEMDPYVDKFVLVESAETFRGNPKPFNFAANASRFEKFSHKIIYVQVDQHFETENPWDRETFQRNQILRGLIDCQHDDIILISDVDEIVRGREIPQLCNALSKTPIVGVSHNYHSNFLNFPPSAQLWRGTVATIFRQIGQNTPQSLRGMKDLVPSAATGWHFTWQGDAEEIIYKLGAFSHAEADTPENHWAAREGFKHRAECPTVPVDDTFPAYVRENQEYLLSIGYLRKHVTTEKPAPLKEHSSLQKILHYLQNIYYQCMH
ncbi:MAG: hypothetical protein KGZ39_07560 [Simkania sp.]|nr:hypothetical protein [Simkania sp.]